MEDTITRVEYHIQVKLSGPRYDDGDFHSVVEEETVEEAQRKYKSYGLMPYETQDGQKAEYRMVKVTKTIQVLSQITE